MSLTLAASDPEGQELAFAITSGPAQGTLAGVPPFLIYTPVAGFTGLDSFEFVANDGALDSVPVTILILVVEE